MQIKAEIKLKMNILPINFLILYVFDIRGFHCKHIPKSGTASEGRQQNVFPRQQGFDQSDHNPELPRIPKHRRRGLVPKSRRRGDLRWSYQHMQSLIGQLNTDGRNVSEVGQNVIILSRKRRWDYDDESVWAAEEDYNAAEPKREETDLEKFAKQWQEHALKVIFIFSFCAMIVCCCCACCKRMASRLCEIVCWHCRDWRDICLNRDPNFRRARQFADDYGIKLDHTQYQNIKANYEDALDKQGHGKVDLSGR